MVRRCTVAAFWLVLVLFVVRHPDNAARTVHALGDVLALLADALALVTAVL
ncbi:hypothetical protein FHX41_5043 [Actinomadura hallensis]|uniref:Uncharacterized protein n=1 Tax=Actinomadura hallensis TaxID=337895 RepID=A0A543IL25_9ACTN|nr:hypothetical protein FHX41_5043 [Actinomadura hallensis]